MIKVFTNGCFDIIHPGHIALLKYAKSLGDKLYVAVDGDLKVSGSIIFSDSTHQSTAPTYFPSFNGIKEFTSSQDWTVPSNISKIMVKMDNYIFNGSN